MQRKVRLGRVEFQESAEQIGRSIRDERANGAHLSKRARLGSRRVYRIAGRRSA